MITINIAALKISPVRYINLCTIDDSFEAKFLKDYLSAEGIECIVTKSRRYSH
jgi:hypothetical protein